MGSQNCYLRILNIQSHKNTVVCDKHVQYNTEEPEIAYVLRIYEIITIFLYNGALCSPCKE